MSIERLLAHVSLDATVEDVKRICNEFRWEKEQVLSDGRTSEDLRAAVQLENRSFTWREQPDGSTELRIVLPPDKACSRHHSLVHEGGWTIERNTVASNTQAGKGFGTTMGFVSRSKKALLPTRHRFRFVKPVEF